MKDSGIEWIGIIPETWSVKAGKHYLTLLNRKPTIEDQIITCFRDGEVTLRSNRREDGFTFSEKEIGYQGIKKGDLVVHGMDGFAGAIGISDSDGKGTPILNVLESSQSKKYLMYFLRSAAMKGYFLATATGIRVRSCDLRWSKLASMPLLLPPLSEQQSIAKYLDHKTSQINALVSNIESQITKLDEYKKALITQAVTKGLDPDVEMKDSGVKWIDDMPKEWHLVPAKHLIEIKKRIAGKEGYTVLSITQSGIKSKDITSGEGQLAESYANYQFIHPGEFGMNHMDLLTGWIDISNHFGVVSPDYRVFKICHSQIDKRYLLYLYQMCYKNKIFYSLGQGAALMGRWRLPATNMMNMKLPVPPVDEQKNIADFLDHQCNLIDRSIGDLRTQLTLLGSYKKSLIFDYVTGKKEVPADFRKEQSYEK